MGDFPELGRNQLGAYYIISPYSACSIGAVAGSFTSPASAAWPSANRAIYVPFRVDRSITAVKMWWYKGGTITSATNFRAGVYSQDGTRLFRSVITGMSAGTNAIQEVDITDTRFGPGLFYMALSCSSTATVFFGAGLKGQMMRGMGVAQQAAASALPDPFTMAAMTATSIPLFGLSTRVTI
jgi:hypothetical protein